MEGTPEIAAALDIYAEESVSSDEQGKVLHVYSENSKIREILTSLFYDTLNIEFNMPSWIRSLVKYGDFFLFNDVNPKYGVINAFPLPISEIEREEGGYTYVRWKPDFELFKCAKYSKEILGMFYKYVYDILI